MRPDLSRPALPPPHAALGNLEFPGAEAGGQPEPGGDRPTHCSPSDDTGQEDGGFPPRPFQSLHVLFAVSLGVFAKGRRPVAQGGLMTNTDQERPGAPWPSLRHQTLGAGNRAAEGLSPQANRISIWFSQTPEELV